jgi:hypothetical protein
MYSGQSRLMEKTQSRWQNTDKVLGLFMKTPSCAKRKYRVCVANRIDQGRSQELTGVGLVRSAIGWDVFKIL